MFLYGFMVHDSLIMQCNFTTANAFHQMRHLLIEFMLIKFINFFQLSEVDVVNIALLS